MPIVILVGGLIVAGIIGLRALRLIAVGERAVTVRVDQTVALGTALVYKPWFSFTFQLMAGTITSATSSSVFSVAPRAATTSAANPYATFDITGITPGTGTIRINGASANGVHDNEVIAVTVIP